jgi:hypothetical protein
VLSASRSCSARAAFVLTFLLPELLKQWFTGRTGCQLGLVIFVQMLVNFRAPDDLTEFSRLVDLLVDCMSRSKPSEQNEFGGSMGKLNWRFFVASYAAL